MSEPPPDPAGPQAEPFTIVQLNGSYEAFGALIDFLSRIEPFSRYDVGNFARALRSQLAKGHHLAAITGKKTVGYVGWLPTNSAAAELWTKNQGPLTPAQGAAADAVVLTIVAATDKRTLPKLIRRARELNPDRRVYFKREYDGTEKAAKKTSVRNIT